MYKQEYIGGIAKGRIRAHSKTLLPGKLKLVTVQAVIVPIKRTIKETPNTR